MLTVACLLISFLVLTPARETVYGARYDAKDCKGNADTVACDELWCITW